MHIKTEDVSIVFKCHDCYNLIHYSGDKDFMSNFLMQGLQEPICKVCGGEFEFNGFETK